MSVMHARRAPKDPLAPRFDVIDLDPYGSAAPFLDGAVQAVADGGLLCVTCTDMPVLSGNHAEVCFAKYGVMPTKATHLHEFALRTVLSSLESHAVRYRRHIEPLLSVSLDFYVRLFVRVHDSPVRLLARPSLCSGIFSCFYSLTHSLTHSLARSSTCCNPRTHQAAVKQASTKLHHVYQSTGCEAFFTQPVGRFNGKSYQPGVHGVPAACEETGQNFKVGGPIWGAPMHSAPFVAKALRRVAHATDPADTPPDVFPDTRKAPTHARLHGLLLSCSEELPDVPLYVYLQLYTRCSPP